MPLIAFVAARPPRPRLKLGFIKHPDVSLLAHMAIIIGAQTYDGSGQLRSRNDCFRLAINFVATHIWPHTGVVEPKLRSRSVFLGQGGYELGSIRRWVGDIHGLVMAERVADREASRSGSSGDFRGRKIRADADNHLQNIIAVVNKRWQIDAAYARLLSELQQLQIELF